MAASPCSDHMNLPSLSMYCRCAAPVTHESICAGVSGSVWFELICESMILRMVCMFASGSFESGGAVPRYVLHAAWKSLGCSLWNTSMASSIAICSSSNVIPAFRNSFLSILMSNLRIAKPAMSHPWMYCCRALAYDWKVGASSTCSLVIPCI